MITFEAQDAIDATTGDENLKCHLLAKCGVNAISKLQNLLFPLLIENNDCAFAHNKVAIKRITHPIDRFLVAERMSLLIMKQHSTEQPRDFLVRINNQAALCELTKLAADPVQEITKLVSWRDSRIQI